MNEVSRRSAPHIAIFTTRGQFHPKGGHPAWTQQPPPHVQVSGGLPQSSSAHSSQTGYRRSPGSSIQIFRWSDPFISDPSSGVMAQDSAPCTVRAAVPLQVGDGKTEGGRPGVYVIEVTFPKPLTINEISFKNFYTAFLTVRIQQKKHSDPKTRRWRTCVRDRRLMTNPHTEDGSQDYVSIHAHQMLCATDHVISIRLFLRQPSPLWTTFTVEDLQINPLGRQGPQKGFSWWLNHLPPKEQLRSLNKAIPDPNRVSSELQQMWVLTEVMRSNQSSASVGRFDVDGCYDINLLSYT